MMHQIKFLRLCAGAKAGAAAEPQPRAKKKQGAAKGPEEPRLGKVALRLRLTQAHQEWAAATLIQVGIRPYLCEVQAALE